MKKLFLILAMLLITTSVFAKQFAVFIKPSKGYYLSTANGSVGQIATEINSWLLQGFKVVSITPIIESRTYASEITSLLIIFDDGKE